MAEKSFGVKEVNLIGASGTPTITSPNNLNLNAINVAISTNVSIGGTLSVTGNVSIGGTLTYEDVTNIDSVGLITARSDINAGSGNPGQININPTTPTSNGRIKYYGTKTFMIDGGTSSDNKIEIYGHQNSLNILCEGQGETELYHSGTKRLETNSGGVNILGSLTVNGSSVSAGSPTPTTSDIQVVYEITNQTSFSYYRFAGNGVDSSADDPDLYLMRGFKYRFINNSGGSHPFKIRTYADASTSSDTYNYNTGVTGQGNSSGNIDFAVPYDAPAVLYYQCGSHSSMFGKIYIRGAGGQNDNVGFTTFSQGIDIDDAAASEKWTIVNNSANTLRFMRGTTTDFSFGPSGQLGLGGWASTAYGEEGQVARSNSSSGGSPQWASSIYYKSSLKDYDITGVSGFIYDYFPTWVEKLTILFHNLSLSGTNQVLIKLRNGGAGSAVDITSGYNSTSRSSTGATNFSSTDGFVIGTSSATHIYSGKIEIQKFANLKWIETHSFLKTGSSGASQELRHGAGVLTISNTIATGFHIDVTGTNTFDGNTRFTVSYQ